MSKQFRPSINIIRDVDFPQDYVVTPNAERVFRIISDNYLAGNRAFSILGTYGTGKSSFLLAFEQQVNGDEDFFSGALIAGEDPVFLKVVGHYGSMIKAIANEVGISDVEERFVLQELQETKHKSLRVLIIDEFGKFLEYAGKHEPERELYFIQTLAEYASDPENQFLLIVTLHQSFDAYAQNLGAQQRNEWEKVRGRLTEIAFNEPVEQLLFIAAHRIPSTFSLEEKTPPEFLELVPITQDKHLLSLSLTKKQLGALAGQLFPLDILAAAVLVQALQQYGQNDRSLFTFLESQAHLGLKEHIGLAKEDGGGTNAVAGYHLPKVYDFLIYSFYSVLSSYHNPAFFQWTIIRDSLDRVEGHLPAELHHAAQALVKIIGLMNIFSTKGIRLDLEFLQFYGKQILGLRNVKKALEALEHSKIIYFQGFRSTYILFEGTDINIEESLKESEKQVEPVEDVVPHLIKHFDLPELPAKSFFYETGTPRYFKFELSNQPVTILKKEHEHLDGYVNLIFEDTLPTSESDKAILHGVYPNTDLIRQVIKEIDITTYALKNLVSTDRIAKREVRRIQQSLIERLNDAILEVVLQYPEQIQWYYQGKPVKEITNATRFNQFLSRVCQEAYPGTPSFPNELVNKTKISASVSTARKKLVSALVSHWKQKDLGFPAHQFPAEKGIYLSLLANKFHTQLPSGQYGFLDQPSDETFQQLWEAGDSFFLGAQEKTRNLGELVSVWKKAPFRLKQGFIDFWLPIYLFIRRDDCTFFDDKGHLIPILTEDVLELVVKKPARFSLKSFVLSGQRLNVFNKYRELLQLESEERLTQVGFLDTVRPFMVFLKSLPPYALQTKEISQDAIAFRSTLTHAKDPESVFFESLPQALGYQLKDLEEEAHLAAFFQRIQDCIRALREAYPNLIHRVASEILRQRGLSSDLSFSTYRKQIEAQFTDVKVHLAQPKQKSFLTRLRAPMEQADEWVQSLSQAVLNKRLDSIRDQEERVLMEKLADSFRSLDNIRDFTNFDSISEGEEVIKLEITSLRKGREQQSFSNIAKINEASIAKAKKKLLSHLSGDREVDIAVLSEMLTDLLRDHGEA